ncbi:hypothetical protein SNEBB_011053 [Seison nebaliae]|nr:hypothetical protein SNEBB_011053 [Seison nebaliae]
MQKINLNKSSASTQKNNKIIWEKVGVDEQVANGLSTPQQESYQSKMNDSVSSSQGGRQRLFSTNRDKNAFWQQRLPAYQPVLTARVVIPVFFIVGILFIAIGTTLFVIAHGTQEKVIDYTQCANDQGTCIDYYENFNYTDDPYFHCSCNITLELEENYRSNLYIYYGLTNYYQNHRRYVKSRDDNQLIGKKEGVKYDELIDDCDPYRKGPNGEAIAPCGAIANSLFNDSFQLFDENDNEVSVLSDGIAWKSDVDSKFKNPNQFLGNDAKPPNWPYSIRNLTDQYKNEDLIVWMRTAALPTFRKLWRRIDHTKHEYLIRGNYTVQIEYNYPVHRFEGTKRFIIANTSWIGGRNLFIGIAYIVVGSLCLIFAFVFIVIHKCLGSRSTNVANNLQKDHDVRASNGIITSVISFTKGSNISDTSAVTITKFTRKKAK